MGADASFIVVSLRRHMPKAWLHMLQRLAVCFRHETRLILNDFDCTYSPRRHVGSS